MTPEQQRIAIAEACGWKWDGKFTVLDPKGTRLVNSDGDMGLTWKQACLQNKIPDYLNDLNAMHEAEKAKDMHFTQKWVETIVEIALMEAAIAFHKTDGWDWVLFVSRLSSAQRAEAFLKTLNLWKE